MVDKGCFSFCFYIYSHGRWIIIQQMALEHCRHLRHVFYAFMCRYSCSPRREPSICRIIATSMTFGQNKKWSFFCKYVKNNRRKHEKIVIFYGYFDMKIDTKKDIASIICYNTLQYLSVRCLY